MKKEIIVSTDAVLEARPLAELVAEAGKFNSRIMISMEQKTVNVKSIMGIMGFGLDVGKRVELDAVGDDEAEAISAIEAFLTRI
jgi:phosphotransferase system HPr (HPr) family protein